MRAVDLARKTGAFSGFLGLFRGLPCAISNRAKTDPGHGYRKTPGGLPCARKRGFFRACMGKYGGRRSVPRSISRRAGFPVRSCPLCPGRATVGQSVGDLWARLATGKQRRVFLVRIFSPVFVQFTQCLFLFASIFYGLHPFLK